MWAVIQAGDGRFYAYQRDAYPGPQQAYAAGRILVWTGAQWQPVPPPTYAAPPSTGSGGQLEPYSAEAVAVFRRAAQVIGIDPGVAESEGLHYVLDRESSGWVGRPNYTFNRVLGDDYNDPDVNRDWSRAHDIVRRWSEYPDDMTPRSSATGLGQLLRRNVERYYPSGVAGIGDPIEEAVGMMRYILNRYDPGDGSSPFDVVGEYYRLPKCEDVGVDPDSSRFSYRALSRYGGPGCKPGGGY